MRHVFDAMAADEVGARRRMAPAARRSRCALGTRHIQIPLRAHTNALVSSKFDANRKRAPTRLKWLFRRLFRLGWGATMRAHTHRHRRLRIPCEPKSRIAKRKRSTDRSTCALRGCAGRSRSIRLIPRQSAPCAGSATCLCRRRIDRGCKPGRTGVMAAGTLWFSDQCSAGPRYKQYKVTPRRHTGDT